MLACFQIDIYHSLLIYRAAFRLARQDDPFPIRADCGCGKRLDARGIKSLFLLCGKVVYYAVFADEDIAAEQIIRAECALKFFKCSLLPIAVAHSIEAFLRFTQEYNAVFR